METKSIHIQDAPENDDDLRCLLIHEICHAVAGTGHEKLWQGRMLKAAERAEQIGLKKLAIMIRGENEEYKRHSIRISASYVYTQIEDFVFEGPDASYERVIKAVAHSCGIYQHELEEKYVRCKRVYEKAKRGAASYGTKHLHGNSRKA